MPADFDIVWDDGALALWAEEGRDPQAALALLAAKAVTTMKALIPVSKVQPVYASGGATVPGGTRYQGDFPLRPSGYLRSSVHAYRMPDGSIIVGPTADYALYVNSDTRPHVIQSTGSWPLRNRATGQVFGPIVHHPGTHGSRFVQRTAEALGGTVIRV